MIASVATPDASAETAFRTLYSQATTAYMAGLAQIADMSTLTTGMHGYDYAITVPQNEKLALLPQLAELTIAIEDEYGVKIATLAMAGPPSALRTEPNSLPPASAAEPTRGGPDEL